MLCEINLGWLLNKRSGVALSRPFGVRQSLLTHVQKQRLLHSITYLTEGEGEAPAEPKRRGRSLALP